MATMTTSDVSLCRRDLKDHSSFSHSVTPLHATSTLIKTNLDDANIFRIENPKTIQGLINSQATIHTWSPLKATRRIITSFYSVGAETKILTEGDQHFRPPKTDEVQEGEPPNKNKHIDDLTQTPTQLAPVKSDYMWTQSGNLKIIYQPEDSSLGLPTVTLEETGQSEDEVGTSPVEDVKKLCKLFMELMGPEVVNCPS